MKRHRYVILLFESERQQLMKLVRSGQTPSRIADRARIILWAHEGQTINESARRLGCHRETIIYWRSSFLKRRSEGIPACLQNATPHQAAVSNKS